MSGTQRYRCKTCGGCFTVERKSTQKSDEIKRMAIHMYLEGLGFHSNPNSFKVKRKLVP